MAISEPRIRRRSLWLMAKRSWPWKCAEPLMSAPGFSPSRLSAVTVFPEPVSPTIPRIFPGSTSKDRPRTARTTPSEVGKETVRSSTASRLMTAETIPVRAGIVRWSILEQGFVGQFVARSCEGPEAPIAGHPHPIAPTPRWGGGDGHVWQRGWRAPSWFREAGLAAHPARREVVLGRERVVDGVVHARRMHDVRQLGLEGDARGVLP